LILLCYYHIFQDLRGSSSHFFVSPNIPLEAFVKAMALDPANPDALHLYSDFLADAGYVKRAIPLRRQLSLLEPLRRHFRRRQRHDLLCRRAERRDHPRRQILPRVCSRCKGSVSRGSGGAANTSANQFPPGVQDAAVRFLLAAPAKEPPEALPRLGRAGPRNFSGFYAYVGASERVMDYYDGNIRRDYLPQGENAYLWPPVLASVRKTARFKSYVRAAGLVDSWRANGWPDLCHPTTGDDFECD
jgi:hypothetical protein